MRVTVLVAPRAPDRDDDELVAEVGQVDDDVERRLPRRPARAATAAVLAVDADVDRVAVGAAGEADRVAVGDLHAGLRGGHGQRRRRQLAGR